MKSNLLRIFFEWALITSVLMSVGFFIWYFAESHALRGYIDQKNNATARFQEEQRFLVQLNNETQAYEKTNVDLQRFIASLNQPAPAPVAPAKPAAR